MSSALKIPFYAKIALIFIGIFAFVFTMRIGQQIIAPLVYSIIIGILLNPLVNFMVRKKINRVVAITIAVTLATVLIVTLIYVVTSQLSLFSDSYPQLKVKFSIVSNDLVHWISDKFKIREVKINTWFADTKADMIEHLAIREKLTEAGRMMIAGLLLPVYVFLFLYYKALLLDFIRRLFRSEHQETVESILHNSKKIIQSYLVGLVFEMVIVAVLNSVGLLLLGIEYAIILGIIGAILNLIPYLGGIIGTAMAMIVAFVTKDSSTYALLVFAVYIFIQLLDNNFIVPKIVASRVKINGLISIIVVLLGGAIWGIPGMFLSIPLTAILKAIFDHIEPLKPWGLLLGSIVPTVTKIPFVKLKK